MLYKIKKCKKCGKRTKKLYYHNNRKNNKKWIPILYYCSYCNTFNGSAKNKKSLKFTKNNDITFDKNTLKFNKISNLKDLRFRGETHCNTKMIKLYGLINVGDKKKWIPYFWYCINCKKVISRI